MAPLKASIPSSTTIEGVLVGGAWIWAGSSWGWNDLPLPSQTCGQLEGVVRSGALAKQLWSQVHLSSKSSSANSLQCDLRQVKSPV